MNIYISEQEILIAVYIRRAMLSGGLIRISRCSRILRCYFRCV
jgi:hypothetical protein